jgi:hypothetical protein
VAWRAESPEWKLEQLAQQYTSHGACRGWLWACLGLLCSALCGLLPAGLGHWLCYTCSPGDLSRSFWQRQRPQGKCSAQSFVHHLLFSCRPQANLSVQSQGLGAGHLAQGGDTAKFHGEGHKQGRGKVGSPMFPLGAFRPLTPVFHLYGVGSHEGLEPRCEVVKATWVSPRCPLLKARSQPLED